MEMPKELRVAVPPSVAGDEPETEMLPVSPTAEYFNSAALSPAILVFMESDTPIDDSPAKETLQNLFLPANPRFSSLMVRNKEGIKKWKRVAVNLDDHIRIPVFPSGEESYDQHTKDYISALAMEDLSEKKPLWEIHLIKYPTKNAEGTMVFKLHHALGDGFSLMCLLFSCVRRADDPTAPLTFPSSRVKPAEAEAPLWWRLQRAVSTCGNTVRDFCWSLMMSNAVEDDVTPVRSGVPGAERRPLEITTLALSLNSMKEIKNKVSGGGTLNDVITGIIFQGVHMYMEAVAGGEKKGSALTTALVLLNTRAIGGYQYVKEMTTPWGNQFGFLHVPIPNPRHVDGGDPMGFVYSARKILTAKKNSMAVYLTARLLQLMRKARGPEATAAYIHTTLRNTSMTISNLTGPIEQMGIAGHPLRSFYFMVARVPQSLTITMVSYMDHLKVAFGTEKGFIDSGLLISCMEKSFERIYNAATRESNK